MAIAHDDDSRVACAHPPYEGQVLEAGDQFAGTGGWSTPGYIIEGYF